MRRRINILTPGFVHKPRLTKRQPSRFVIPPLESALEPHINFSLIDRLDEEQAIRDPPQPFPEEPLPGENGPAAATGYAHAAVQTTSVQVLPEHVRAHEAARVAAERGYRFRHLQSATSRQRCAALSRAPSPRAAIMVAEGGTLDAGLIEDRDYDLDELVGPHSRFRFRLIPWGGR